MSVVAKALIDSQYAPNSFGPLYTAPNLTSSLIDKFTVTNTSANTATISVYLVPSGGTPGASNLIISALSLTAGEVQDIPELKNHILNPGGVITVIASAASSIVVRASGREAS